jgi:hypothetical protein
MSADEQTAEEALISGLGLDAAFEVFRMEYDKLSRALLRSMEAEDQLLKECRELKADLISNATRLKLALRLKTEDEKTMAQLRNEAVEAWEAASEAKERESAAQELINALQDELSSLKGKKRELKSKEMVNALDVEDELAEDDDVEASNAGNIFLQTGPPLSSFKDWKTANNIWTPSYPQPPDKTVSRHPFPNTHGDPRELLTTPGRRAERNDGMEKGLLKLPQM